MQHTVCLGCYTTSVQLHKETSHHSSTIGGKTEALIPETTESGNISPPLLKLVGSLLLLLSMRYHENSSADNSFSRFWWSNLCLMKSMWLHIFQLCQLLRELPTTYWTKHVERSKLSIRWRLLLSTNLLINFLWVFLPQKKFAGLSLWQITKAHTCINSLISQLFLLCQLLFFCPSSTRESAKECVYLSPPFLGLVWCYFFL